MNSKDNLVIKNFNNFREEIDFSFPTRIIFDFFNILHRFIYRYFFAPIFTFKFFLRELCNFFTKNFNLIGCLELQ